MKFTSKMMIFLIMAIVVSMANVPFESHAGGQGSKREIKELSTPLSPTFEVQNGVLGPRLDIPQDLAEPQTEPVVLPGPSRAQAGPLDWKLVSPDVVDQLTAQFLLAQAPTIACDETKQGSIDQTDQAFQNGTRFDQYILTTQQPNQSVILTLGATANFLATAEIYFIDPQRPQNQQFVFLQGAYAPPGRQVQQIGILPNPGQYAIVVFPLTNPQGLGPYTLRLECRPCGTQPPPTGGACSMGGTVQNPIAVRANTPLNCQLTQNDVSLQRGGQTFFAKFFTFESLGARYTVSAMSTAFTPQLLIVDPPGNPPGLYPLNQNPAMLDLPTGRFVLGVTSTAAQATGAFTFQISGFIARRFGSSQEGYAWASSRSRFRGRDAASASDRQLLNGWNAGEPRGGPSQPDAELPTDAERRAGLAGQQHSRWADSMMIHSLIWRWLAARNCSSFMDGTVRWRMAAQLHSDGWRMVRKITSGTLMSISSLIPSTSSRWPLETSSLKKAFNSISLC